MEITELHTPLMACFEIQNGQGWGEGGAKKAILSFLGRKMLPALSHHDCHSNLI